MQYPYIQVVLRVDLLPTLLLLLVDVGLRDVMLCTSDQWALTLNASGHRVCIMPESL